MSTMRVVLTIEDCPDDEVWRTACVERIAHRLRYGISWVDGDGHKRSASVATVQEVPEHGGGDR